MGLAVKIIAAIGLASQAAALQLGGSAGTWVAFVAGILASAAAILGTDYAESKKSRGGAN